MSREQNVPLLLWISTAILAHIATGGGAEQVARVIEDREDLQMFARTVRQRMQPPTTIEIGFENLAVPKPDEPPSSEPPVEHAPDPAKPEKKKEKKDEPPKVEKKPAPPKIVLPPMATAAPPPPKHEPPAPDRRIAVKQHAAPDQEDNPTAKFIGDEANHVKEESIAQFTAHDQDDPHPTPGGNHAGPTGRVGNSESEKIGGSEDHPGDPTHAPGESSQTPDTERAQRSAAQSPTPAPVVEPRAQQSPRVAPQPSPAAAPAPAPGGAPTPDTIASPSEGYHLDPSRAGGPGQSPKPNDGKSLLPPRPAPTSPLDILGLGGAPTPGGINLNLTPQSVIAVVGEDRLNKERMADGERRKTAHRGSWQNSSFERWRAAIENYVSSVKPGNQTALNSARSPFATYLVTIHNHIHPIFADDFLGSLEGLPTNHPMNDRNLVARLEIVLDRDDGRVVKMGVVRTSGITAFDVAALDSVQRSSPFGKPPKAIVSPDGNVYFHWEFHRDPIFACSTVNARPFLVNTPPPAEPSVPKSPSPPFPGLDPREQSTPPQGARHGYVPRPKPDPRSRREPG